MASNLVRHLPMAIRRPLNGLKVGHIRNASSDSSAAPSTSPQQSASQQPIPVQINRSDSSGSSKIALGLALGVSLSVLLKDSVVDRFFPKDKPPKEEPPSIDPKLLDHIIKQDNKVNDLERRLSLLLNKIREQEQNVQTKQQDTSPQKPNDLFELSEIIQANNMALEARHNKALEDQRQSMIREHLLKVEGELLKVENKYRPTINKIRELESYLEKQRQIQEREAPARLLWLSCQSLLGRLRDSPQQPLEQDPSYEVLKQFAANDNQLAISILNAIPLKVLREGVQSEESLVERFHRLETICKRVALVDFNKGLASYLLSYLQSVFLIDTERDFSEEALGHVLVDPSRWTTLDILARVRYCLGQRNLEQAVRYANQLKGQARVVARDWIRDARTHLATRQVLTALSSRAEVIALYSSGFEQ